jgi:hypothetical protein
VNFDAVGMCRGLNEEGVDCLIVRVAAFDDIIGSKRSANRPKDVRAIPYLESLRDVRDGR